MVDLRSSTRIKGGLILVDENSAALAQGYSDLLLERILHFLASLLDIALGLIDVPFSFKLTVASCPPARLFDLAFGYLGHILGLVLLAHRHSVSRRERSLSPSLLRLRRTDLVERESIPLVADSSSPNQKNDEDDDEDENYGSATYI